MEVEGRPLAGQLALVTGAARRIGAAVAEALADAGADVVLHYGRSAAEAERLAAKLASAARVWTLAADLSRPEEAEALFARAADAVGRAPDLLVNNASAYDETRLRDLSYADLERAMRLTAWAPFALTRAFALSGTTGSVVNLLDTRITDYDWAHVAYILAKKTLAELTRMAAIEYAPAVRVNAVAPGLVLPPEDSGPEYVQRLEKSMPLRRAGSPADIAAAVIYLATAPYVTGQVIYVDGGRHLGRSLGR